MRNLLRHIIRLPRKLIIWMLDVYQMTLSPDHGVLRDLHPYGFCRHEPTCSMYAKQVIEQRGVFVGGIVVFVRLLSCNPLVRPSEKKIKKMIADASQKDHECV